MTILITICGRAGSKGLKGKNHKIFLGKPLIEYTLRAAALFAEMVSEVRTDIVINSDSTELLSYADGKDVFSVVREDNLAGDRVSKTAVIIDTLVKMEQQFGVSYDCVIDLDITSPLRKKEDIMAAYTLLKDNAEFDTIFSVTEARRNPYFNMVQQTNSSVSLICPSEYESRQEAPAVYDMNASIYVYRRSSLLKYKRSFFEGICGIIKMMDTYALDIDSEEDFHIMEVLSKCVFAEEFKEILNF